MNKRRRKYVCSIRAFLVATGLLCLIFGYISSCYRYYQQRADALANLEKIRGFGARSITTVIPIDFPEPKLAHQSWATPAVRPFVDAIAFEDTHSIYLSLPCNGTQYVSRADIERFKVVPELIQVTLNSATFDPSMAPAILDLPLLKLLDLADSSLDGSSFVEPWRCDTLELLDISGTRVGDDAFTQLRGLPRLRALICNTTQISDETCETFCSWPLLEMVDLEGTRVGDKVAKELATLPRIRAVAFSRTKITDEGVDALANLATLEEIRLGETQITDAALRSLSRCGSLKAVDAWETGITDQGVEALRALPGLKSLSIFNTMVTDDSIDAIVSHQQLEKLNVFGTRITSAGYDRLRAELPGCKIL